jgi:argininosuccinate synthase
MGKIILAYSGGLDTSVILKWLLDKGYEVICYIADVGQEEDFETVKKKALQIGASKVYIVDLKKEFVTDYIFEALKANAIYENKYYLGTSLARPLIAKKQIEIAKKENTHYVAHGATGKGNDQVRFEITYMQMMKDVKIISPWKDPEFISQFHGRNCLLKFAKENNIPIESITPKPFSIDENLLHTSFEGGDIENPLYYPEEKVFKKTVSLDKTPSTKTEISIQFSNGIPIVLDDKNQGIKIKDPVTIITYLNHLGGKQGIGRCDVIENRFVGMKSRGIYENPAATILWKSHEEIESMVLDREVMHLKESMKSKIATLIYNGLWDSPEFSFLMAAINQSQKKVSGVIHLTLFKGNIIITGRESENSLYCATLASMDTEGDYDYEDAKGFIKINAIRLKGVINEIMG